MEGNQPFVSIVCMVYNHEKFIADAIEGFLMQKANFPIEIIIHDDASTDGSADIVRRYEEENPSVLRAIYQVVNQHSIEVGRVTKICFSLACGNYIALCEGDDYWTDPEKLQRQVDFLEKQQDYSAIAENGLIRFTENNKEVLFSQEPERDINIEEMVIKRRFPTASVVFRTEAVRNYLNDIRCSNDTILWCYLASQGKFIYRPFVSSVYRKGTHGVVLSTETLQWVKNVETWNLELIRLFSPIYFDKKIALHNIWGHYWKAYLKYSGKKLMKKAGICLYYCFRYDFRLTCKKLREKK